MASENCQDRQVVSDGFRDMQMSNYQNTQSILNGINEQIRATQQGNQTIMDKLCQLELDGFKQKVADQAAEIAALKTAISQTAQTATLVSNNDAQTATILSRIGQNCCQPVNYGCGCGAA